MMIRKHLTLPILAVAMAGLALGGIATPTVSAQTAGSQSASREGITEETLKTYARATIEVQRIDREYQSKLKAADTAKKRAEIYREATNKVIEAVKDEGLTVEEYNQIFRAAQTNSTISKQVSDYMRDTR